MLSEASFGVRALVASAILHASVAVAVGGHAAASLAADRWVTVELEDAPATTPAPAETQPETASNAPGTEHHVAPTHHHDYPVPASHDSTPHDPSLVHAWNTDHPAEATEPSEAPEVIEAPAPAPARFVMSLGAATTARGGPSSADGRAMDSAATVDSEPVAEAAVAVPARLVSSAMPTYPPDARAGEIEADVPLEIVVDKSGTVVDARPLQHAGYGFDASALQAIRAYRFSPAQREGRPVRVRMKWTVLFRLK